MSVLVSVIMPVSNDAEYLAVAIESILSQTLTDFELIIADDFSSDDSLHIAKSYTDPRVRIITNDRNLGRSATDNKAFTEATGKYIAKMDADDISLPDRLSQQVELLEKHPEVNVVGTWIQDFGVSNTVHKYCPTVEASRCQTLFSIPVGNATAVMRRETLVKYHLVYDETLRQSEDYRFFAKGIRFLNILTLPRVLYRYRVLQRHLDEKLLSERRKISNNTRKGVLTEWLDEVTDKQVSLHNSIACVAVQRQSLDLDAVHEWLMSLLKRNTQNKIFDDTRLKECLAKYWFLACYHTSEAGFGTLKKYRDTEFSRYFKVSPFQCSKFIAKMFMKY